VEVTCTAATSCMHRRLQNILPSVIYSPSHRQAGAVVINVQSTLRTGRDLYKNVSLAVQFGSNGNSYTISKQSDVCIYIYILHKIDYVGRER
jgi:hypothetical protein